MKLRGGLKPALFLGGKMKRLYILFLLVFCISSTAFAMEIDRQKLIFSNGKKRETITIKNNQNQKIDVKVQTNDECKNTRIFPRLFSLQPNESQSVKVFVEKAEKDCRLSISEKPSKSQEVEESENTSAKISIAVTLSIPIVFEDGR